MLSSIRIRTGRLGEIGVWSSPEHRSIISSGSTRGRCFVGLGRLFDKDGMGSSESDEMENESNKRAGALREAAGIL